MLKQLSLTNSKDIVCNSFSLISGNSLFNVVDLFLTKSEGANKVGIAPETLNTIQEVANALNNDPAFFATINDKLALKRNVDESYSQIQTNTLLSAKQNIIADGDLTIAKTSGLQSTLNAKQNLITDNSLTIARTIGLQDTLNAKQNLIATKANTVDVYTQAQVNGLVNA